jgi:hypothetical protein
MMKAALNPRLLPEWERIIKEANKLLPFRNRLAHDPTVVLAVVEDLLRSGGGNSLDLKERLNAISENDLWALTIEEAKLLRRLGKPKPPLISAEEVIRHRDAIGALTTAMWNFRKKLPKRARKPLQEPPEPKPPPRSGQGRRSAHTAPKRKRPRQPLRG